MSDPYNKHDLPDEPGAAEAAEPATEDELSAGGLRADPRLRPPDPAGTRPEWDPNALLPSRRDATAPGALWRPADEDDEAAAEDDRERQPVGATAAMAATPAVAATALASSEAAPGDEAPSAPAESRFNPRFQFALGVLMAVAAAAIVLFVAVLAGKGGSGDQVVANGPTWSAWSPASGEDGAAQIAAHVAPQYRLPNGKQLVAVTGGPLQIAGLPVTIAIRETVAQGGDIKLIDGSGVLYRMCGLGPSCKLPGKPSIARMMLLRREALELALYSFRYLGVSDTTVFMPPNKGEKAPSKALFFRRGDADVQSAVSQPLDATLTPNTPTVKGVIKSPDADLVTNLTIGKLFQVSFTQANQDARAFMVLDPLTN